MYIRYDWKEYYSTGNKLGLKYYKVPMFSDKFLHEDYASLKEFFYYNTEKLIECKRFFDLPEPSDRATVVVFYNQPAGSSFCDPDASTISISSVTALIHEYVLCRANNCSRIYA